MRALHVFPLLAVGLLACPPAKDSGQTLPPPSQPASQPANPSAGTSTVSMKGAEPSDRDQVDPDGIVRRGGQLSAAPALTVTQVIAQAEQLSGKTAKVTGRVGKVCENKGCWFVIADGAKNIRITAKDYGFFVPAKSPGMQATIEGEIKVTKLDAETIAHYESEGATDVDPNEIAIVAAALEMKHEG